MDEERWETVIPPGSGYTSGVYHNWKSDVLKIRDLPEYKLRKLYKAGFSARDIEQDKHFVLFPPIELRKRKARGIDQNEKRGRRLGAKKKQWLYARALKEAAENVLAFYRLEPGMLQEVRAELESFKALMKKFAHKA